MSWRIKSLTSSIKLKQSNLNKVNLCCWSKRNNYCFKTRNILRTNL